MKIEKSIGTPDEARYSTRQCRAAVLRIGRTRSSREANAFYHGMMKRLGVGGRAKVLAQLGRLGMAFDLLMRSDEAGWRMP